MERLLIALIKLALGLVFALLKLLVRLALFAYTGDWHRLDKLIARARELMDELRRDSARPPAKPPVWTGTRKPSRQRRPRQRVDPTWPFEFPEELTADEPSEELRGGESVIQQTISVTPARHFEGAGVSPQSRSRNDLPLALAIRDPRVLRDAMVLTAALGQPRGGARGRG